MVIKVDGEQVRIHNHKLLPWQLLGCGLEHCHVSLGKEDLSGERSWTFSLIASWRG